MFAMNLTQYLTHGKHRISKEYSLGHLIIFLQLVHYVKHLNNTKIPGHITRRRNFLQQLTTFMLLEERKQIILNLHHVKIRKPS